MFSFLTYVKLTNFFIFPGGSYGKESACNAGDLGSIPGLGISPGEVERLPTPVLSPGESHGRRSPVGCSHGVAEGRTQLSDFTFTFHFHTLEREMATHSSVFAWRIPGIGEPGGLPSMGSHRVRHD